MTSARAVRLAFALAGGALCIACPRAGSGTPGEARAAAAVDSVEGIVRMVGVDALPEVSLALDDGTRAPTLVGGASLQRVAGLRIRCFFPIGGRAGNRINVTRFTVLAANGVAATDGVLAADGDAIVLVTADSARHRLVYPPPVFRTSIGHRVWVSGPLDRAAVAFGVIE